MIWKYLVVLLALTGFYCKSLYKICVPVQHLKACQDMEEVKTKSKTILECVSARDRVDCMYQIQQRKADLVPVYPEDMYIATRISKQDFVLLQEYRKNDELHEEFALQSVAVVHKDLSINNLNQLKGLKSCHSGVYKFAGYKAPLRVLSRLSMFPEMNSPISSLENGLSAFSMFFNESCMAGKWTNPERESIWKSRYKQLCALCEYPEDCDREDEFSGNQGALQCLTNNRGHIAFTKLSQVRNFFEPSVDDPNESPEPVNPDDYMYLCTDGSKIPIKRKACSWGAKPWGGFLGHNDLIADLQPLREKLKQLAAAGAAINPKPEWFKKVLHLSKKIHHVVDIDPISPALYLDKANYTQIIEMEHGAQKPKVRLCVTSDVALAKCRTMALVAYSRGTPMTIDCVQESTESDCLRSVQNNGSHLAIIDGMTVVQAAKKYNLHPVFHEVYDKGPKKILGQYVRRKAQYAVAVVKKNSTYTNMEELRGKRSCHDPYGSFSGLFAPLYHLVTKGLISPNKCLKDLGTFFSGGSCLPGVENSLKGDHSLMLRNQCTADDSPLTCLEKDRGDVAFVSSPDLQKLNDSEYVLLCLNRKTPNQRFPLQFCQSCNIAMIPPRIWVSSKDHILDTPVALPIGILTKLANSSPDLFDLYGEYLGSNNVIFTNSATGIEFTSKEESEMFMAIHDVMSNCGYQI